MTPSSTTSDASDDFEAEVRAMLTRRAADVSPSPAARRRAGRPCVNAEAGNVISLTARERRPSVRDRRRRALVAAAAAVVIALGGITVATERSGEPEIDAETDDLMLPVPGSDEWDPATAPPVWPVVGDAAVRGLLDVTRSSPRPELGDPRTAAEAYLVDVGGPQSVDGTSVEEDPATRQAHVAWETPTDEPEHGTEPMYEGGIYLRDVGGAGSPVWVVVGAVTDGVTLEDVRTDGERLAFTISVTDDLPEEALSLREGVDGAWVTLGGSPLPQRGPADPASGRIVEPGRPGDLALDVDPGSDVDILVRHVGGTWLSVTHASFHVPEAPSPPAGRPGEVATRATDRPTEGSREPEPPAQATIPSSAIWPLDGATPPQARRTPESTALAYLADVADLPADHVLDLQVDAAGDAAVASYRAPSGPGPERSEVRLSQTPDGWVVTWAGNPMTLIAVEPANAAAGRAIDITVTRGGRDILGELHVELIGEDGSVIADDRPETVFPERWSDLTSEEQAAHEFRWSSHLTTGDGVVPRTVRVSVLQDDDGDPDTPEVVVGHASVLATRALPRPVTSAALVPPGPPDVLSPP